MRPRIFMLMLTAFGLVILLGLGGTSGFFWLAVSGVGQEEGGWPGRELMLSHARVRDLARFYARNGSWEGVEVSFAEIDSDLARDGVQLVTLLDSRDRVVATSRPDLIVVGRPFGPQAAEALPALPDVPLAPEAPDLPGEFGRPDAERDTWADFEPVRGAQYLQTLPIRVEDRRVGTLLIAIDGQSYYQSGATAARRTIQGVLSATLALGAILLALAAFFSGRISTPLRQLTGAARALAAGDMGVRVRPSAVREVGELAGAFNSMADALVRADEQRRQLTADVAHELRTPLAIIKGRLEGVQDGIYSPDADQIAGLLDEVALLERLIEDLRILALADAGQLPLYPEAVDPAGLLSDAQRSFAHQAEERGVALELAAADELPEISADPQRIAQVLGNLVSNALRYTPAGGRIALSATVDHAPPAGPGAPGGRAVCFTVSDTGAGIAAADLPHIFDRFYRADRARTRGGGGAGLGLAIARRIVEAHGGRIWAESLPGQGTTVRFRLPAG